MVVLIDRDTASAAEILTAALADDAGATVVGTRSFGKGVFQQEIDLSNGGALKLTIGEYFTPDGENLAGKGIQPDVKARDEPGTNARRGARGRAVLAEVNSPRDAGGEERTPERRRRASATAARPRAARARGGTRRARRRRPRASAVEALLRRASWASARIPAGAARTRRAAPRAEAAEAALGPRGAT